MKVLYFTQDYGPHDERFLTALAGTTHEVLLLRAKPMSRVNLPPGIREVGFLNEFDHKHNSILKQLRRFREVIAEHQPDLVHAGPMNGPAFIAAVAGFSPLVSMSWGCDMQLDVQKLPSRIAIKHTLKKSTIFTGDCQVVADKTIGFGFPRNRIHIFPWGVDLAHFDPNGDAPVRQRLGWTENFVFLCNRSMEPKYGVDVVVHAFIEAVKINSNLRLLLYGKGSQEDELQRWISASGIEDKVFFGGFVSRADLPGIYRSADVFITASHCDGSSVSLMEALACGRPVIASDIPANLEWVKESEQGWIFRDSKSEELTQKMLSAASNQNLTLLGENARVRAEKKADWSRNFPVLLEAYQHALEIYRIDSVAGKNSP